MKSLILIIATIGSVIGTIQAQNYETVEAKYRGKPIIQMTLNDKKTWVLLDTGSEYTVLDTGAKKKYGFFVSASSANTLNISGLSSTNNRLHETSRASLQFGHVQLKGPTYAFDLSTVATSIQRRTGKRITAIIGTHMMRNHGFILDMSTGTASIKVKPKKKRGERKFETEEVIIAKNANSKR
ncbi:MAG: aspartyl protease family protein [Reichenbachiella sp.]|uniref:aspartyl protease family protein n=1 Tax=Reichenbachiella sp. TaxID=2184521 RepID=UPI00329A537D